MTTYEEISMCPKKNREFWTEQAKLFLAIYRSNELQSACAKNYRRGFRSSMSKRRNQEYLIMKGQMELSI